MIDRLIETVIDNSVQCWGCGVFDSLFQIVSSAAAKIYDVFSGICLVVFGILFTIFVLNVIWQNMKSGMGDPWMKKSFQKVFISSIVALSLLGVGVSVPRFITMVVFEPVANVTLIFTQKMVNTTPEVVNESVTYEPVQMSDDGFYRPQLRDTVISIMKTTVSQFQGYVKLGAAIVSEAFTWRALLGIGALIKHITLFLVGFALAWGFFKLFFRYCCYFADFIIAMAMFAFFFPLSLMMYAFKDAEWVPKWILGIGDKVGVAQIKTLINSIVTLGSVVISYTVIMVIIAKFFIASGTDVNALMNAITGGQIFEMDLDTESLENVTLFSLIALMYVLSYIFDQIPEITKMILSAFGVSENKQYSEQLADDMTKFGKTLKNLVSQKTKTIATHGASSTPAGSGGGSGGGKAKP